MHTLNIDKITPLPKTAPKENARRRDIHRYNVQVIINHALEYDYDRGHAILAAHMPMIRDAATTSDQWELTWRIEELTVAVCNLVYQDTDCTCVLCEPTTNRITQD